MEKRTKADLLAWIEQHQPVTREKLLGAFEDMDYEQLQGWLSTHVLNYGDVFFRLREPAVWRRSWPEEHGGRGG
jgi:hypothetical protein